MIINDRSNTNKDNMPLYSRNLILVKTRCLIILLVTIFTYGVSPYFYQWKESFNDLTTKKYPFSFMLASTSDGSRFINSFHDKYFCLWAQFNEPKNLKDQTNYLGLISYELNVKIKPNT